MNILRLIKHYLWIRPRHEDRMYNILRLKVFTFYQCYYTDEKFRKVIDESNKTLWPN